MLYCVLSTQIVLFRTHTWSKILLLLANLHFPPADCAVPSQVT